MMAPSHVCNVCQILCSTNHELQIHKRKHTDERPYKCDLCPVGFKSQSNLNRHKNTYHSNARPYMCPLCYKDFIRSDHLKNHIRDKHAHTNSVNDKENTDALLEIRPHNQGIYQYGWATYGHNSH